MKIDFEFQTEHGLFRDALYLPDDHGMSDEQIEAIKVQRKNNWIYVVENPPASQPESVEIEGVTYEKFEVDGQVLLKPVEA